MNEKMRGGRSSGCTIMSLELFCMRWHLGEEMYDMKKRESARVCKMEL